jgi:hypothetical protein
MSSIKLWSVFLNINCNKREISDVNCRVEEFVEELQTVKRERIINFAKSGEELKDEELE